MNDDRGASTPSDPVQPTALYSVRTAAHILGEISERRVWQFLATGELRRVRVGHRTFVRGDDLLAFVDRHTDNGNGAA